MKNLLVVVDMQNDFVDGALGSQQGLDIVDDVCAEIDKEEYDCVVATLDTHFDNYMDTLEGKNLPVVHCIKDSEGWQYNAAVKAALDARGCEQWFEKVTFGSVGLQKWVQENGDDLQSITLIGLCTDICVMSNAIILRATFPNTPIYVVENACWATTQSKQDASFAILESCQIYRKG